MCSLTQPTIIFCDNSCTPRYTFESCDRRSCKVFLAALCFLSDRQPAKPVCKTSIETACAASAAHLPFRLLFPIPSAQRCSSYPNSACQDRDASLNRLRAVAKVTAEKVSKERASAAAQPLEASQRAVIRDMSLRVANLTRSNNQLKEERERAQVLAISAACAA